MADLSAWTTLIHIAKLSGTGHWYYPDYFISKVLCWFNRQLVSLCILCSRLWASFMTILSSTIIDQTNVQTLRLLNGHDNALPQKMTRVAKEIFDLGFLPSFTNQYPKELCVSISHSNLNQQTEKYWTTVRICVLPLPQGFYYQEEIVGKKFYSYHDDWRLFHDEVFGKAGLTREDSVPSVINCSRWYPHLCILPSPSSSWPFIFQYDETFGKSRHTKISEKSFSYIIDCLPYAQTTEQNLNAFRAIAYLLPNVAVPLPWHLPADFWFSSVEFLKVSL